MRFRLTKISGGKAIRSDSVIGISDHKPEIGQRFEMVAKTLDASIEFGVRVVSTSPVTAIDMDVVTTESGSKYKIENLADEN